jgi:hypothetical protein
VELRSWLFVHRARAEVRRAERARLRTLERELASFSSAADRADLECLLDACPDGLTVEVREILARQAVARAHSRRPWRAVGGL